MLINNVVIENFRCYYGRSDISFNKNGKITLIYGDSGFGKSSFLQFFKWMFYGLDACDFGNHNDKQFFNESTFRECPIGEIFKVFGQIDFEHLGVKYSLTKCLKYKATMDIKNCRPESTENTLKMLVDDNWQVFNGDITNKINSILPKGLSKYFLLDGEKARDIVLNSEDLKKAIHALFGLDAYANAISHIGSKGKKNSVIGFYSNQLASKITTTSNNMTASEMQDAIQDLYDTIEEFKTKRHEIINLIEAKNARRDEIFKIIGEANNKSSLQQLISSNMELIKNNQNKIESIKGQIGDLFFQSYPYLFLSRLTSNSSAILREKHASFANTKKNVFENLKKDLLKEIKEKNICVCGRELDEYSSRRIDDILAIMPPDSYAYQFAQFVSKSKQMINNSQMAVMNYDNLISDIASSENKISELENNNREKLDDLKRLDDAKLLVDELEALKIEIEKLSREKAGLEGQIAQKKQIYEMSNRQYNNILKDSKVSSEYNEKIEVFEQVRKILELEKISKEQSVKETLDSCVRDIFKKLTTQTELDADKIKFVNDDFSLRTTYLTGGQLAVDEYAYVIGIVKALQECKMDNNENPIIIDAPFAFTGNDQSEHIFKTLPSVSKQTVLLTLDLNKIKDLLANSNLYDFYIIKNDTQEKAIIKRGVINDIKF